MDFRPVPNNVSTVCSLHWETVFADMLCTVRERRSLHCLINCFSFRGFSLCFVLGPGGLREAPGGPGKAHRGLWGACRGPPDPPEPESKNLRTHTFCRALLSGRGVWSKTIPISDLHWIRWHVGSSSSSSAFIAAHLAVQSNLYTVRAATKCSTR